MSFSKRAAEGLGRGAVAALTGVGAPLATLRRPLDRSMENSGTDPAGKYEFFTSVPPPHAGGQLFAGSLLHLLGVHRFGPLYPRRLVHSSETLESGGWAWLGRAPYHHHEDWVAIVRRVD